MVEIAFFHGAEKVPFALGPDGRIAPASNIPFHGIISTGLLRRFRENGTPSAIWLAYAHRIHDGTEDNDARLAAIRNDAKQCAVLSFGQSALAAQRYVENYCATELKTESASCEVWNIKEGHTSTVWRVAIDHGFGAPLTEFIVNVARDKAAGRELVRTSSKMQAITQRRPDINLAKVLAIDKVRVSCGGETLKVPVTRNEWIADAYEIHQTGDQTNGTDKYLLIERFLTHSDRPSHIRSIRGRRFNSHECQLITKDIERFLTEAALECPVHIDINQGDVVWNGTQAIVVAIR